MSKKATVIPQAWGVSRSSEWGQVFVEFEVSSIADESATRFRFGLSPLDALALARELQDDSLRLLLSLAGYEIMPGRDPKPDDDPMQ